MLSLFLKCIILFCSPINADLKKLKFAEKLKNYHLPKKVCTNLEWSDKKFKSSFEILRPFPTRIQQGTLTFQQKCYMHHPNGQEPSMSSKYHHKRPPLHDTFLMKILTGNFQAIFLWVKHGHPWHQEGPCSPSLLSGSLKVLQVHK